jgi:fructosamine-3-kinase
VPEDLQHLGFGFPVTTCCGSTEQDNTWTSTWPEFFSTRRILPILPAHDPELRKLAATITDRVIPRLLSSPDIKPALVHGDLWSGNAAGGKVFDPSACYAHSEYELGIMKLFGGFGDGFWGEYCRLVPKTEPVEEWEDRLELYALFHRLNHYKLFGGAYRDSAVGVMKRLIRKYASE